MKMYEVTERIEGAHPIHTDYPLLPGDLLVEGEGGWTKECPGLTLLGFLLTNEQVSSLKKVEVKSYGLNYYKEGVSNGDEQEAQETTTI